MKVSPALLLALAAAVSINTSGAAVRADSPIASNPPAPPEQHGPKGAVHQVLLSTISPYPSVKLSEYTLVTQDLERDRAKAESVVQAKMRLPFAMHTKQRSHFERALDRGFTFRAEGELFDREAYISNRLADPSKVKRVDYRNLVVQFIGDFALVTYSNVVEDEPGGAGAWKADMTWADVLTKEDGEWKYLAIHLIAFRDLTTRAQE